MLSALLCGVDFTQAAIRTVAVLTFSRVYHWSTGMHRENRTVYHQITVTTAMKRTSWEKVEREEKTRVSSNTLLLNTALPEAALAPSEINRSVL